MARQGRRGWVEVLWWLVPAFAVVFPLLRLLPLDGQFATDWGNHKWIAAYAGEYLRAHHSIPVVLNTQTQAGMPFPMFYGTLFYPLLAPLTTWLLPGVVIRLVVLAVTWLQFRLVSVALVRLEVPLWTSRGIACLVTWAIYPLTNLYTRSAITEYVATALLTCLMASWFLLVHAKEPAERRRIGLGIGLLFALSAGTHPITALYSLPILILLIVAAYSEHGRDLAFWRGLVKALAAPIGLAVVVLAPWIYVLVQYRSVLKISADPGPWFYPGIDEWATRFYPIPHDARTDDVPASQVVTPYLDAQINVALLALLIGWIVILLWRNRTIGLAGLRGIAVTLLAFAFFTWISLYESAFDILPDFTRMLQIAYRAVTYQNIALLLAIFLLASLLRRRKERVTGKPFAGLLIGALLLSGVGIVVMFGQVTEIMQTHGSAGIRVTASERHHLTTMPTDFYGYDNYATPPLFTHITAAESATFSEGTIPIGNTEADFGVPKRLYFSSPSAVWLGTNVQAFPWNRLMLDGALLKSDQLRIESIRYVVWVTAGDHTLEFQTIVDPVWLLLRDVSFAVLALWFLGFGYLSYRARRARLLP